MKYLKIDSNKVLFTINGSMWKEIDEIEKNDLLELTHFATDGEFTMDDYDKTLIGNQAHQIIYKNIHDKFKELLTNKDRFKDESEALYKDAIEKYSK